MSEASKSKKGKKRGRPTTNKELDKEEVLDKAVLVFAEKGFDGAQIKELANRAGINTAVLHYHFKNKQDLWEQSVIQLGNKLMARFESVEGYFRDLEGASLAKAYNRQLIYFSAEFPAFHQIVFHEMCTQTERADWLYEQVLKPLIDQFLSKLTPFENKKEENHYQAYMLSIIIGTATTFFTHSFQIKKRFGIDTFDKQEIEKYADFVNELLFAKFK